MNTNTYGTGDLILDDDSNSEGPGHNAVAVDIQGDPWMVYHTYESTEFGKECGSYRRSLMIGKIG